MDKAKKNDRILFVINSYQQYKNYIQTQALDEIKDRIVFLVHPKVVEMKLDFGAFQDRVISYAYPDRKNTLHRHVFNLNSYINRTRHNVFLIRTLWLSKRQRRIYGFLSLPLVKDIFKLIALTLSKDPVLSELVKKIDPALMLLPSHAFDGMTFELIRIAKKMNIPSFMVVENWDTLSTKTIFTFDPDYLGVWSKQQIEHAINIRNFPEEKIFTLGTPKYTHYLKSLSEPQSSPYPFKYALFSGMSDLFDEISALKKLDEIIEQKGIDLKIVYRPTATQHTRKCPDVFFEYDFKHCILDLPARTYYKKSATWDMTDSAFKVSFYPDPNYFPKLLSNMEFMICAHSTMILEASLFDKKMYLLSYEDGVHNFGSSHWGYETQKHLVGVERLPNARMVRHMEDLEKIFSSDEQLKENKDPLTIDYFIARPETANYAHNLKLTIDKVTGLFNQNKS